MSEDVEASRCYLDFLYAPGMSIRERAKMGEEVFTDTLLILGDRFNVYQRPGEGYDVHV